MMRLFLNAMNGKAPDWFIVFVGVVAVCAFLVSLVALAIRVIW